jgi:putative peptide zinc metalloprotease protein
LNTPAPDAPARERAWLLFFAIASFIYRMFITFAIALFVAGQYFIIGVLLAVFAVVMSVVLPLVKAVAYLALHPRLRRHRLRAAATSGLLVGGLVVLLFGLPVPFWTNAEGVIWVPEQSIVRSGTDGFVANVLVAPGTRVTQSEPLIEGSDPVLPLHIRVLEARREELLSRYQAERIESIVRAQITLEEMKALDADLDRAREKAHDLIVRSPADGVFIVPAAQDLPGKYLKQGEQIGYVLTASTATARVVVPQESVDLVRSHTEAVRVKLAETLSETMPATLKREVPGASDRLPSLALAQAGGGRVALDPRQSQEAKALQTHFEFELELPAVKPVGIGGRVYVRFEHGAETIAGQAYRALRQLFLKRFAV